MPKITPNPRIAHLAYLLMMGAYDDIKENWRVQRAIRHARGEGTFVLPNETVCSTTGKYIYMDPNGAAIRRQLDALVRDGVSITAAQLHLCRDQQLFVEMKRLRRAELPDVSLQQRLERRVLIRTARAALCLGVEALPNWNWWGASLVERDPRRRLWLLQGRGDLKQVMYLVGVEGGHIWMTQLPEHITTIEAARGAEAPPAVIRARDAGHHTRRHGDLWIAEVDGGPDDLGNLPSSYNFDAVERVLHHPKHGAIYLPFRFGVWPTAVL